MKNVLILCTGNSCRSIMGEVLLRDLGLGRVSVFSAGSKPAGQVNANAVALLQRRGHDVANLRSKSWDEFAKDDAPAMDYVFTVCSSAAKEACPVWIGAPIQAHWGIDDPADATGTTEEILAAYELAYVRLRRRAEAFFGLPFETMAMAPLREALMKIGKIDD